jgi:hypothetical protein
MESNQKPVPCPTRTIKAGNTNEKKVFILFYFISIFCVTFFRDDEAIHSETAAAGQPPSKK